MQNQFWIILKCQDCKQNANPTKNSNSCEEWSIKNSDQYRSINMAPPDVTIYLVTSSLSWFLRSWVLQYDEDQESSLIMVCSKSATGTRLFTFFSMSLSLARTFLLRTSVTTARRPLSIMSQGAKEFDNQTVPNGIRGHLVSTFTSLIIFILGRRSHKVLFQRHRRGPRQGGLCLQ